MIMDDVEKLLRMLIAEDLKNIYSKHKRTVDSQHVLKMMHDSPGVMDALQKIDKPSELAAVIEALIDACPIVRKGDVMKALGNVQRHERTTRR